MIGKSEITEVWSKIVAAYNKIRVFGKYGITGNPNDTLDVLFEDGVTPEQIRQVLAIQALMRPHDGRFDQSRQWLSLSLDESCPDWHSTYCRCFRDIDAIHPTHMDNLAEALRKRMNTPKN